jgi:hypothetical protein
MLIQDVATGGFLSWCEDQGIQSQLRLRGSHPYRYMACNVDLTPDSDSTLSLLTVPLNACLKGDSLPALADRLTFEKIREQDSKYFPYLCMLPPPLEDAKSSLLEMPRFWSPARLASINNWDGGQLQGRLKTDALSDEEKLVDAWALACVKSRSNFLEDGSYAMTPLLDMLNHDCSVTTKARTVPQQNQKDGGEALELLVRGKSFKAGEEVMMSYGGMTNLETLSGYGFVAENNLCNVESLDVRLIMSPDPINVAIAFDGTIAVEALAMLRRLLASGDDLREKNRNRLTDFIEPLSDKNELEVVSLLATELDMSAKYSRRGAMEATGREDQLVTTYLAARASTFEKGIESLKERFPELEY